MCRKFLPCWWTSGRRVVTFTRYVGVRWVESAGTLGIQGYDQIVSVEVEGLREV